MSTRKETLLVVVVVVCRHSICLVFWKKNIKRAKAMSVSVSFRNESGIDFLGERARANKVKVSAMIDV